MKEIQLYQRVTLTYCGVSFDGYVSKIDINWSKADVMLETGYVYRSLSLKTFAKGHLFTLHNETVAESERVRCEQLSDRVPRIFFVDIKFDKTVHAQALGFTDMVYGYAVGHSEKEAADACMAQYNKRFEKNGDLVRVSEVNVAREALSPFKETLSFPEQVANIHLIPSISDMKKSL